MTSFLLVVTVASAFLGGCMAIIAFRARRSARAMGARLADTVRRQPSGPTLPVQQGWQSPWIRPDHPPARIHDPWSDANGRCHRPLDGRLMAENERPSRWSVIQDAIDGGWSKTLMLAVLLMTSAIGAAVTAWAIAMITKG